MADKIVLQAGKLLVPDCPVIPFIEGDGIGPDIWKAARRVIDAAVQKAYGRSRRIQWKEVLAGEKAYKLTGQWLPRETLDAIREFVVAIKGPLTTPVGEGFRSLNVTIRQELDLYACVRPVKWIRGVPSPLVRPEKVDVVIFRENTEDIYAGIEWDSQTEDAARVRRFLSEEMRIHVPEDAGVGVKYISKYASERIMRRALQYAIENKRRTVTIVHKGNIMKYTEGSFKNWCYQLAKREFRDLVLTEDELAGGQVSETGGTGAAGGASTKILVNDRITDNMFQQLILKSGDYDVIVTPNLNGDYLSDAAAALVGGLGLAPGANIGDSLAVFEATHGTAPKYAGQDKANPGSLILSGCMMLEYIGWVEASELIKKGLENAILAKTVTYDLARQIPGAKEVRSSEFAQAVIEGM